jgi:anti-sigma B factor antagonist
VLRSLLVGNVKASCPALVLDLSGVRFIDSAGLAAIIEYFRDTATHDGVLCLSGLNDTLKSMFEIVRLDKLIPIFPTTAQAISAVKAGEVKSPGADFFGRTAA